MTVSPSWRSVISDSTERPATGLGKNEIARTLSVSIRSVSTYLQDINRQIREERKRRILDLWMECRTQDGDRSRSWY